MGFPESLGASVITGGRGYHRNKYGIGPRQRNGLLLGYTALSEKRIAAGIAQLARVLDRMR